MFRVIEKGTNVVLHETHSFEKAKNYAELYKKNMRKSSTIQQCQTVWSSDTIEEIMTRK